MGCDIHIFAEVKKNNQWEKVGDVFKAWDHKPEAPSFTDEPYDGRSYDLFAILADVRNGRGFAGVKTGEGFNPIEEPRGLPFDVTDEVRAQSDFWDGDGHSHSFFTVKELLDYDWNQITMRQGVVSYAEYLKSDKITPPDIFSADVTGPKVVTLDENTFDQLEAEQLLAEGKSLYVLRRWSVTYRDQCEHFLENTIPSLQELGADEDVRIVFWFDN